MFQLRYHLAVPQWYMQSLIEWNILMWSVTVIGHSPTLFRWLWFVWGPNSQLVSSLINLVGCRLWAKNSTAYWDAGNKAALLPPPCCHQGRWSLPMIVAKWEAAGLRGRWLLMHAWFRDQEDAPNWDGKGEEFVVMQLCSCWARLGNSMCEGLRQDGQVESKD
jgi:hypothetical protein